MRSVQLDVTIGLIVVDGVFVGCVTDDVCVCVCVCVCRRNCELGATLATVYHTQHLTKRVNVHTHEDYLNRQSRCQS